MATYNFTVRATDNSGSFADRAFSMTVNNTQVDRFVGITNLGIIRSKDGLTWDREDAVTPRGVTFGDGRWIGYHRTKRSIWSSPDAMNWVETPPSFDKVRNGATIGNYFTRIKYRGGKWWGFIITTSSNSYFYDVYTSTNATDWAYHSNIMNYTTGGLSVLIGVNDFEFDPVSGVGIATTFDSYHGHQAHRLVGDTWTNVTDKFLTTSFNTYGALYASGYTTTSGRVYFQNGLWVVSNGVVGVWTGYNGLDWTYRTVTGNTSFAVIGTVYSNGRLYSPSYNYSSGSNGLVCASMNAGRTWSVFPMTATDTGSYSQAWAQNIASFNGTTVWIGGNGTSFGVTTNDFTNMTVVNSQSAFGANNIIAVSARHD